VFKVGGKMFCVACTEVAPVVTSFKCDDEAFAELCEREGIVPAPYLARAKWVAVERWSALDDREFVPLIERAYRLVKQRLPKKMQEAIDKSASQPGRRRPKASR
jgi:predicted DNA-binding protein (MmcQ/YjbR family)